MRETANHLENKNQEKPAWFNGLKVAPKFKYRLLERAIIIFKRIEAKTVL